MIFWLQHARLFSKLSSVQGTVHTEIRPEYCFDFIKNASKTVSELHHQNR
jgi:hypothetical protein